MAKPSILLPIGLEFRQSPEGWGLFTTLEFSKGYCFGDFLKEYVTEKSFKEKYGRMGLYDLKKKGKLYKPPQEENVEIKRWDLSTLRDISIGEELSLEKGKAFPWNIHPI